MLALMAHDNGNLCSLMSWSLFIDFFTSHTINYSNEAGGVFFSVVLKFFKGQVNFWFQKSLLFKTFRMELVTKECSSIAGKLWQTASLPGDLRAKRLLQSIENGVGRSSIHGNTHICRQLLVRVGLVEKPFPFYFKRQSDIIWEEQGKPEISFPQEKLLRVLKPHLHANMPETGSKYRVRENGGLPPPPPVWRRFALAIMEISRSHEREVMRSEMRSFGIHVWFKDM